MAPTSSKATRWGRVASQIVLQGEANRRPNPPRAQRPRLARVSRLRLTARCLGLAAVFVGDARLDAELFDARGELVEQWVWE